VTKPAWLARAQHGWPADFPVAQFPNGALAVALAASLAGRITDDRAHDYASAVFHLALAIWAYLELTDGANWFRRALGAGGLAYVVIKLATELG
jgi:hypothetical protein